MDYKQAEDNIISAYKLGFYLLLIALIMLILFSIVIMIFRKKICSKYSKVKHNIIISIFILIPLFCSLLIYIFKFNAYTLDNPSVNKKEFEQAIVQVIGYNDSKYSENTGRIEYSNPIFKNLDNGEIINVNVGPIELNKVYTIIYLKHTKIGEIIIYW